MAVSPEYRFCPKDVFPAQVHDVKAAVRWLRTNAASLNVDSDRIGAMGFSAGAHLALMLGLTGPEDGLEGLPPAGAPSSRVRAVVDFYAPIDLAATDMPDFGRSLVKDFLGGTAAEKPAVAAKASPLTFVSRGRCSGAGVSGDLRHARSLLSGHQAGERHVRSRSTRLLWNCCWARAMLSEARNTSER